MHPDANEIAGYLDKTIPENKRRRIESHVSSCRECLNAMTAAHEAVAQFKKNEKNNRKNSIMKKINPYMVLTILFFLFSFITPRFFVQALVGTLVFGIKWVADSRSAKMLVMIYDAWKKDGDGGVSRILDTVERNTSKGIDPAIKFKSKII